MISPARQSALNALDVARPVLARMDIARGAVDTAADIVEGWSAVESALRLLVDDEPLTGQTLIREARQRQLLTFDQANALAELSAARDRLDRADYRATEADVNSARTGFLKFEAALMDDGAATVSRAAPPETTVPLDAAGPGAPETDAPSIDSRVAMRPTRPRWIVPSIAGVVVLLVAVAIWARGGSRGNATLQQAAADYAAGRRGAATTEFQKAQREEPKSAGPHIYLARMAREDGNFTTANTELQTALELDPNSGPARREMGSLLLAQGKYDLARTFYIHALEVDTGDLAARGWLGCALIHLGRTDEGLHWLDLAGNGPWTGCRPTR